MEIQNKELKTEESGGRAQYEYNHKMDKSPLIYWLKALNRGIASWFNGLMLWIVVA